MQLYVFVANKELDVNSIVRRDATLRVNVLFDSTLGEVVPSSILWLER